MFLPWYLNYWELPINIKQLEKYFCVKNYLWLGWEWEDIWTCLLLCLGVLQTSNEINSDSEKLSQLQKIIHHQQDNLSEQLSIYRNFPTEEEFLKSQIAGLLKRQGQMAIKLCQELIIHTSGNWGLLASQVQSFAPICIDHVHHLIAWESCVLQWLLMISH